MTALSAPDVCYLPPVGVPPAQRRPTLRDLLAHPKVRRIVVAPSLHTRREIGRQRLKGLGPGSRVNLGCGLSRMDGWVNVDNNRAADADLLVDLRAGFPAPAGSVRLAFSEHVVEHLEVDDARRWFSDLRRAMVAGGVLRIATPDLARLVDAYVDDWRDQEWVRQPGFSHVTTGAAMLNLALRGWGHSFVYDAEALTELLSSCGFRDIVRCELGRSEHHELCDLERRADSTLILEARA